MSNIDKVIIEKFAKEYDLPEFYVKEKLESLITTFKNQPNVKQMVTLNEYKNDFLGKLIIFEDDDNTDNFTYVIKANNIYFDLGQYMVSGPCVEFMIFNEMKSVQFFEKSEKVLHPELSIDVIEESELLEMILEMKDTIEYNVKNTMCV